VTDYIIYIIYILYSKRVEYVKIRLEEAFHHSIWRTRIYFSWLATQNTVYPLNLYNDQLLRANILHYNMSVQCCANFNIGKGICSLIFSFYSLFAHFLWSNLLNYSIRTKLEKYMTDFKQCIFLHFLLNLFYFTHFLLSLNSSWGNFTHKELQSHKKLPLYRSILMVKSFGILGLFSPLILLLPGAWHRSIF
jgi:hypothetical protein